jgi:hypothetical protein
MRHDQLRISEAITHIPIVRRSVKWKWAQSLAVNPEVCICSSVQWSYVFKYHQYCHVWRRLTTAFLIQWSEFLATHAGFDSRSDHIFWEVVGMERGPLSFVRITEELLDWKSSGSGSRKSRLTAVEIRRADHATASIHKSWHLLRRHAALGRSEGIVRLRTKATEFSCLETRVMTN